MHLPSLAMMSIDVSDGAMRLAACRDRPGQLFLAAAADVEKGSHLGWTHKPRVFIAAECTSPKHTLAPLTSRALVDNVQPALFPRHLRVGRMAYQTLNTFRKREAYASRLTRHKIS
jgi:hypothetical protein